MTTTLHEDAQAAIDAYQAALDAETADDAQQAAALTAALGQVATLTADHQADVSTIVDLRAQLAALDPGISSTWGAPISRDEFGATLDSKLWTPSAGAVNTDTDSIRQVENVFTRDGSMVCRAVKLAGPVTTKANPPARTWGGAQVDQMFSQRFGRWETRYMSLKPMASRGIWWGPWLRADGAGGEIDMSESIGSPSAHPGSYPNDASASSSTGYTQTGSGPATVGTTRTANTLWKYAPVPANQQTAGAYYGWHVAALEWTPNRMTVLSDNVKVWEATPADVVGKSILGTGFPGTAHLRFTQFVGTDWAGHPDANTLSPYDSLVDYVRVYPYAGQQ